MPEGDNVLHFARLLGAELAGVTLDQVELKDRGPMPELAGRRVESVEARGKHMLVHLEGGWSLRIHLGMHGSWLRLHARQRRPREPTAVLGAGDRLWVCDGAYRAEAMRTGTLSVHARFARLGPDLLAEPAPIDAAVARALMPAHGSREIADLLLDQRVAAGVGNIYKSEVLFECRIHPRTPVHRIGPERMRQIYEKAAHMMRLNLLVRRRDRRAPLRRRETPSAHRFFVYGRKGKPCFDCRTPVERFLQQEQGRATYFCPTCQPLG